MLPLNENLEWLYIWGVVCCLLFVRHRPHGVMRVYHGVRKVYHVVRKVYHGVREVYYGVRNGTSVTERSTMLSGRTDGRQSIGRSVCQSVGRSVGRSVGGFDWTGPYWHHG